MKKNLAEAAGRLEDYWSPRVLGQVNDQYIKVAKVKGDLAWHKHDNEDELFLVLEGTLTIEYQDEPPIVLHAGDIHIVPRGKMHNPVCKEECLIALIEPVTTQHTGDLVTDRTVSVSKQLEQ